MSAMEMFSHENYSPYMWGVLFLFACVGCTPIIKKKNGSGSLLLLCPLSSPSL